MYLFNSLQNQQFTPLFVSQLGGITTKYYALLSRTAISSSFSLYCYNMSRFVTPPVAHATQTPVAGMSCVHILSGVACDMRMGNYFSICWLYPYAMSASSDSLGIRHLTVVPTNFESATAEQPQPTADSDDTDDSDDTTRS